MPSVNDLVNFDKTLTAMVIEVKKTMSKADVEQLLAKLSNRKRLDAKRFLNTVKWPEAPLDYQKRLRDEW